MFQIFITLCMWLFYLIKLLFGVLLDGIKTVFTYHKKIIVLVVGTGLLYVSRLIMSNLYIAPSNILLALIWDGWVLYPFAYVVLVNGGIVRKIKHYFLCKKYRKIFESIKFMSTDKYYPEYMRTTITENMKIFTFYSTIPVSAWLHKQDLLENAFNDRFYEIKDRPSNNRIVDISILTKELPSVIPWDDSIMRKTDWLFIGEGYHGRVVMNLEK